MSYAEGSYSVLTRAQLSYEYLHTNSTTHEFLFGAVVELVDNSHDANATKIDIFTEKRPELRGGQMLVFLDDGMGMNRNEVGGVMTFGYSQKRRDPGMIGQYGNGLKSGAMRIGKDFILFTKKDNELTCVFLSRSFHEAEQIDEVIVPMPSFTLDKKPIYETDRDKEKHEIEMQIILNHSPFKTMDDFMAQFDKIESETGTMVMIYNLRLLENSDPELDAVTDPSDITLADPEGRDLNLYSEMNSLKSYLAIVYADPRMKIYIQHEKVHTRRVISCLYKPKQYKFSSSRFTARAIKECDESKEYQRAAKERQSEAESKLREFEKRNGTTQTDHNLRIEWRKLQDSATIAKKEARLAEERAKEKEKHRNDPKSLSFVFGINLDRRNHCGCMVYNNGRLIKMYQKVGAQIEGGIKCLGVVGIVDVPYVVLEPTHNKQDFADSREYRALLKAMGEYMNQYWADMELAKGMGGLTQFWERYGYYSNDMKVAPRDSDDYRIRRLMSRSTTVQCDHCLKWREVPFKNEMVHKSFPPNWVCSMNPDSSVNKCSIPEKRAAMSEGKFYKPLVTNDKKVEMLKKKLEKDTQEMERLTKQKSVANSKEARKVMRDKSPSPTNARRSSGRMSASAAGSHKQTVQPDLNKPKTKAELRRHVELEKQRKLKEEEERDRKKRQASLDKLKKRRAPTAPSPTKKSPRSSRPQRTVRAIESSSEESAEEEVVEKKPQSAKRSSMASSPGFSPPKSMSNGTSSRTRRAPSPQEEIVASKKSKKDDKSGEVSSTAADTEIVTSTSNERGTNKEKFDQMVARMRHLLSFFLPPQWTMTKDQVNQMSGDDLINMDLKSFFAAYENGLKSLVHQHQRAAEQSRNKLVKLRRSSSAMLALIHAELAPGDGELETDRVDICMEECLTHLRSNDKKIKE